MVARVGPDRGQRLLRDLSVLDRTKDIHRQLGSIAGLNVLRSALIAVVSGLAVSAVNTETRDAAGFWLLSLTRCQRQDGQQRQEECASLRESVHLGPR